MKHIYTISYSSLSKMNSCEQKFINTVVRRLEPVYQISYTDTLLGVCWHTFRKHLMTGTQTFVALNHALEEWDKHLATSNIVNPSRLTTLASLATSAPIARKKEHEYITREWMLNNFTQHIVANDYTQSVLGFEPLEFNREYAVEEKFSVPLAINDNYELHLTGVFDAIGYLNGELVIQDDKTTGFNYPEKFFEKYDHSAQMLLYVNVARMLGSLYPDSRLGQGGLVQGVSIVGVFHDKNGLRIQRSPTYRYSDKLLADAEHALIKQSELFQHWLDNGITQKHAKTGLITDACRDFGMEPCPFLKACLCHTNADEETVLTNGFKLKATR
jgi:PD-(D/E)XK nuclease superfamily